MKRAFMLMLSILFVASVTPQTVQALSPGFAGTGTDTVHIVMDGEFLSLDIQPRIINYQVMVPAQLIFEALGAHVETNDMAGTMTVFTAYGDMTLTPFSNWVTVNGGFYWVNTAPRRADGHVFVTLKLVADASGNSVSWCEDTRTAVFSSP